jgi:TatD DNase family protein
LAIGFHISVAGILTFPKAIDLRETIRHVPLDRLLVETDSPFLAPVPYRGKRNEPAYVERVIATLAELHTMAPAELTRLTMANFHSLFRP